MGSCEPSNEVILKMQKKSGGGGPVGEGGFGWVDVNQELKLL